MSHYKRSHRSEPVACHPLRLPRLSAAILTLLLPLAAVTLCVSAAAGQEVYHETFDHYGYTLPGFSKTCSVSEWPPSLKHLEFRPTRSENVYQPGDCKLPSAAQDLTNYDFAFRVRFVVNRPKALDCRLEFASADGKRVSSSTLKFSEAESSVVSVVNGKPNRSTARTVIKGTPIDPLLGGNFFRIVICVRGKKLEAFFEARGQRVPIGTAEIAGDPLVAFNFSSAEPFDLDDIIVSKQSPNAPTNTGKVPVAEQVAIPRPKVAPPTGKPVFVAGEKREYTLAFPPGNNTAVTRFRLGQPGDLRIVLKWGDDSTSTISAKTFEEKQQRPTIVDKQVVENGKSITRRVQQREAIKLPDAGLDFRGDRNFRCNIRPWLDAYILEDRLAVAAKWDEYEAASQHLFTFEARRDAKGVEQWLDGRYIGRHDSESPLTAITFVLPKGGVVQSASTANVRRDDAFLPLDIVPIANPGVMATAKLPIAAGKKDVGGVPFLVAPAAGNLDLSVVRENFGTWALECDYYLSRNAFSGMPESLMLSVPTAQYYKAHVLCAVADDPARDPVLTTRLTRFLSMGSGGRGQAIADTTIELPRASEKGAALPPGVTLVGEVRYDVAGQTHKAPLYRVEVPIDSGKIQDVIYEEPRRTDWPKTQPYLDFEVLGRTDVALQQLDKSHKPHPTSRSAVHVFGITLERSPFEMEIVPVREGNAYTLGEKPSMNVVLRAHGKAEGQLTWQTRDVDGKPVGGRKQAVRFDAAGERTITVTPPLPGIGHYKTHFQLHDAAGNLLVEHTAPSAIVAPDTRKAGYESPYFSWWFNGAHLTSKDLNVVGPLLKMAGIRRTLVDAEAGAESWQLTRGQIGSFAKKTMPEEMEKNRNFYSKRIDLELKLFPHVNASNIYHETCTGPYPLELFGIAMPLPTDPEVLAREKGKVAGAVLAAELYREKCPQVRPTLVNSGDSLGGAGMLMRHKFPRELMTALGEESLGQTVPPEMSTATNFWMLRTLARKMGYGDVPVDACYEWKGRCNRDLGERKSAAYALRDALIAHAWGCRLVPVTGVITPGNSYHNSIWGDSYMFSRSPENYPHVSFSTTAHLTQLLDGAKFARCVPTGTISVYALEFNRGQDRVYALWTARGTAEVQLSFDGYVKVRHSDMFGRGRELTAKDKTLTLKASGEPCYVVAPATVKAIAVGERAYPEDQPPSDGVQVVDALSDAEHWELAQKPDERLENPPQLENTNYLTYRQLGKYELRAVKDEEKGDCLEVELLQQGEVVPFLPEYTMLRLKTPADVAGTPTTVGVWVKGNSGWGKLMWEFTDADGETWLSCGTSGYFCDVQDWPRQASINFDGWNFVQFPIVQASPVRLSNPGEVTMQWRTSGGGNGQIDYPIKLTGLAVEMTRQALNLTEMKPVQTVIRLKDLSAY